MEKNMSYKLADGSDSSQYKVGDLFERPNGRLAEFSLDDGTSCPYFKLEGSEEVVSLFWDCLKPHPKPFTKDDLKDGMRVLVHSSALSELQEWYVCGEYLLRHYQSFHLSRFKDDLTHDTSKKSDIIKVTDRDGTVVFQREPELIENKIKATAEQWVKIKEILGG
jgi:hypothetical protein